MLTERDHVDMSRHMDEKTAIAALAALAQPTRLQVFRRLVNCYPDELAAGEIARLCKTPHNTMSTHLAIMAHASLISVRKEGRMMQYQADIAGFQKLMNFLLQDCCKGRAEIYAPLAAEPSCGEPALKRRKKSSV
jgi:ArsR family transcriptional regulator, arsenate/arsenite/antimonite-responsive transcriptional repressor